MNELSPLIIIYVSGIITGVFIHKYFISISNWIKTKRRPAKFLDLSIPKAQPIWMDGDPKSRPSSDSPTFERGTKIFGPHPTDDPPSWITSETPVKCPGDAEICMEVCVSSTREYCRKNNPTYCGYYENYCEFHKKKQSPGDADICK